MIFEPISDILATMVGDSMSCVNFLGGSHMPGLSTQALAYFYGCGFNGDLISKP